MVKRSWGPWVEGHKKRAAKRAFDRSVLEYQSAMFNRALAQFDRDLLGAVVPITGRKLPFWARLFSMFGVK